MGARITKIAPGSPASRTIIAPGDRLLKINGHAIEDVLDYKYHAYDARLHLVLAGAEGKLKLVRLSKAEGADIGLTFDTFLMDDARSCANSCVFCFIDQLPKGMRDTLYYKDDDARLSFLQGNYITLTNLTEREINRIIALRVSPINISVHTTDPALRALMLGNPNAGRGLTALTRFAAAGITMNCQIVCCPGLNDGPALQKSMEDLAALYPAVASVSIVPVGLTRHRAGLYALSPHTAETAAETVALVEGFGADCLGRLGSRLFYCADEFYIKAGLALPDYGCYEGFPQLENGVGMMRLLISEFEDALSGPHTPEARRFSIATGVSAAPFLEKLICTAREKYDIIDGMVFAVQNRYFGETIDVAGLLTGRDVIDRLRGEDLGGRLLLSETMLRRGEPVFLDDLRIEAVADALNTPIRIVRQDGGDLLAAMMGK